MVTALAGFFSRIVVWHDLKSEPTEVALPFSQFLRAWAWHHISSSLLTDEFLRSAVSLHLFSCGRVHSFDAVVEHLKCPCSPCNSTPFQCIVHWHVKSTDIQIKLAVSGQIQGDVPDGWEALWSEACEVSHPVQVGISVLLGCFFPTWFQCGGWWLHSSMPPWCPCSVAKIFSLFAM